MTRMVHMPSAHPWDRHGTHRRFHRAPQQRPLLIRIIS